MQKLPFAVKDLNEGMPLYMLGFNHSKDGYRDMAVSHDRSYLMALAQQENGHPIKWVCDASGDNWKGWSEYHYEFYIGVVSETHVKNYGYIKLTWHNVHILEEYLGSDKDTYAPIIGYKPGIELKSVWAKPSDISSVISGPCWDADLLYNSL